MARTQFYNRASHSVVVDGFAVEDFTDGDDAIAIEFDGDGVSATQGLDRNSISFNSQRIARMTVTVKATSASIARLRELANGPHNGNPRLIDARVTTGVNDKFAGFGGGVEELGYNSGGAAQTPRAFRITFSSYEANE